MAVEQELEYAKGSVFCIFSKVCIVTLVIVLILLYVCIPEMGKFDSAIHSREHHFGSHLETAPGLIKPDHVDDTSQNDSLLQSSLYIPNASNCNDNSNTSIGLQSDITQRPDITSVSVPESHDLIASVSNISETNIQSEFNSSSHPLIYNVHSHTEPGIIGYL